MDRNVDRVGQVVGVGDKVAFPVRQGTFAHLKLAKVTAIGRDRNGDPNYELLTEKGRTTFKGPERIIKYP